MIYCANWPSGRRDVWNTLLKARAIENQAFVAGINRTGKDGEDTEYAGESMVIDPNGQLLFAADKGKPTTASVTINREELDNFRRSFPVGYDWDRFSVEH